MAWSALLPLVVLVSLDMQNLASRWGRIIELGDETTTDFTILVPIFGDPRHFRNGDYLERYRQNTLLAVNVDSPKMERFVADLRSQGWRVHAAHLTGRVSCPELVFDALQKVTTRYVIPDGRRHGLLRTPGPGNCRGARRRSRSLQREGDGLTT